MRTAMVFVACILGFSLLACKGLKSKRESTSTTASKPPPPVELPDLESVPVSADGKKAIVAMANARGFGGSAVGVAGTPTPPISALRTLWREPKATEAFSYVLKRGTLSGKLIALAGLYYSDHGKFTREVGPFKSSSETVPLLWNGCAPGGDPTAVSEIVEKPGATQLSGPEDTLAAWSLRNPGKRIELDLVGGGYPASFRPFVPAAAPTPPPSASSSP